MTSATNDLKNLIRGASDTDTVTMKVAQLKELIRQTEDLEQRLAFQTDRLDRLPGGWIGR